MRDSIFWKVIQLLVALATIATPVYMSYDALERGGIPEKNVELKEFEYINPLADISLLGDNAASVYIGKTKINNLLLRSAIITNIGRSPIVPNDYIEPIKIKITPPWNFVGFSCDDSGVMLQSCKFIDAQTAVLSPILLNPGDKISMHIYVTNNDPSPDNKEIELPKITWSQRIINLRSFTIPPKHLEDKNIKWGISSHLDGYALLFTVGVAMLFQALYLHLLSQVNILNNWNLRSILIAVGASLLSITASESIATYFFKNDLTESGVDNWLNLPAIILHTLFIIYLYWRIFKSNTSSIKSINT